VVKNKQKQKQGMQHDWNLQSHYENKERNIVITIHDRRDGFVIVVNAILCSCQLLFFIAV
jgi:hypothetical protein